MSAKYISSFILFLTVLFVSCGTVEPPEATIESREYIWTIDTITSGIQTDLISIWGSSYTNVYACGFDASYSGVYHFNGKNWNHFTKIPQTNFLKEFNIISGLDSNYFILAGKANFRNYSPPPNFYDSGLVVTYNNGNWDVENLNSFGIYALSVSSEGNVWLGDRKGNILHREGNEWIRYSFNNDYFFNGMVALENGEIYANAHYENNSNNNYYIADYLFKYSAGEWYIIDSNITSNNYNRNSFPSALVNIGGDIYGSGNEGIVKKVNNTWKLIGPELYGQLGGTSEKNIFLGNQDFGVLHYNGSDWYRFDELPRLRYSDVLVFENSVFLIASTGSITYIIRGIKI